MMWSTLYDDLFASKAMREVFSDRAKVQAMLDFEAALARAEADTGVIPAEAALAIVAQCRAKRFDLERLAQEAAVAGNAAVPLIAGLIDLVARNDPAAARFVHFGAASQDALDTALVLQLGRALEIFDTELGQLADALAELVRRHPRTVMLGRTLLQSNLPLTFGLKAAGYLSAIVRCRARLRELRPRTLVAQLGGPAGTLAPLGARGLEVATRLAQGLNLGLPDLPWHASRDRIVELGAALGLVAGSLGKMARDLSLLSQPEVGEVVEPQAPARGGFPTPRRQSSVGAAAILAVSARIPGLVATLFASMPQEHERGLGGWQAEWESLPEICLLTSGALMHAVQVVQKLELNPEKMRVNLDATGGVLLAEPVAIALSRYLGAPAAYVLVDRACRRAAEAKSSLREVLEDEREVTDHFSVAELEELCDPMTHLGMAEALAERALAEHLRVAREQ